MGIRSHFISLGLFGVAIFCIANISGEEKVDTRLHCLTCQADLDNWDTEFGRYCRLADNTMKRTCSPDNDLCFKLDLFYGDIHVRVVRGCTKWNVTGLSQDLHIEVGTCRFGQQVMSPNHHSSIYCYCDTDLCNDGHRLHSKTTTTTIEGVLFLFRYLGLSIALYCFRILTIV